MTNTTKQFAELTIAEKFANIIEVLATVEGTDEMVEFLNDRIEKQVKANTRERKTSETSNALQEAVLAILSLDNVRRVADTVLEELQAQGYTDDSKVGLTIARVRTALSALAKEGLVTKFDADRKKGAEFPKVSYQVIQ